MPYLKKCRIAYMEGPINILAEIHISESHSAFMRRDKVFDIVHANMPCLSYGTGRAGSEAIWH
jgi:hypothetical protein